MSRRAHPAVSLLLVVPEAHVRQLDLHFQTAWYDVFHRARPNQISHVLCMGPIVWVGLVFACLLPLPGFTPPGSIWASCWFSRWWLRTWPGIAGLDW